ncbi:MAG: hypothetical protein IJ711_09200 [Lachnospiraceae bacterium]|nr:hypothetical protein [Lachnospiraceae bacterium]
MSYLFAICDRQEQYVSKLAEYLNFKKAIPFQVVAFSSVDKLLEYGRQAKVELLLITEELFAEHRERIAAAHVILLGESGIEVIAGYRVIYKYQSAEQIMRQVLKIYGEIGDPMLLTVAHRQTEVIGVYSPVRRCLQTSFAVTLGQLMAKKKKCLYLNFEPFSGFSSLMKRQYEQDFTDLMYFLSNGMEKLVYKLQGMIESIGELDYIPPALSFLDFAQIDGETMRLLIDEIAMRTDYETVILDLSEHLRFLFDLLLRCDRIFTITKDDGMAQAKLEHYKQLLAYMQKEEILAHTQLLELPQFEEIPVRLEQLPYSGLSDYIAKTILKEE